jgi:hypothetical protein
MFPEAGSNFFFFALMDSFGDSNRLSIPQSSALAVLTQDIEPGQ